MPLRNKHIVLSKSHRRRRDLSAIMLDGAFFSLMIGLGETYLCAYALALGASDIAAGLLAVIPMMAGALLQLATPWMVRWLGSHRRWVVLCAGCQIVSLALFPLASFAGKWAVMVLYGAATLYWAAGLGTGASWNTWMEHLVPRPVRARFFARRVRICQFCVMTGFIVGGFMLHAGAKDSRSLYAFHAIFAIAAVCRCVSLLLLASHSDGDNAKSSPVISLAAVFRRLRGHPGMKLLAYLLSVQLAVQMSGPYFAPFMLKHLKLTYLDFMLLIGLGYLGKVLALPMWGEVARRAGAQQLLWIGGLAILPLSGLWAGIVLFDQPLWYLSALQLLGGVAWAAYELSFLLLFFETIPHEERTSLLALYNVGNAAAMVGGAMLGAAVLAMQPLSVAVYLQLFAISSAARVVTIAFLVRVPKIHCTPSTIAIRTVAVRPVDQGTNDRPILPSIVEETSLVSELNTAAVGEA